MRYTTEDIIERFRKVHGDKYDYGKFVYNGMHVKSIITCKVHGDFEQEPHGHLKGYNCPKCAIENRVSKLVIQLKHLLRKQRKYMVIIMIIHWLNTSIIPFLLI